jgi:putative SOS response-associated peptidase YedK
MVPVVRQLGGPWQDGELFTRAAVQLPNHTDVRELRFLKWGLLPGWAKEPNIGASMINARSESAHEKTSFRKPLSVRRCLIPVDGYYEWQRIGKVKQPFHIRAHDQRTLFFAGLWDANKQLQPGTTMLSCTILTMGARPDLAWVHDRMPVFVPPDFCDVWLANEPDGRQVLDHVLAVADRQEFRVEPVSVYVNNARNEGAECIQPLDGQMPDSTTAPK